MPAPKTNGLSFDEMTVIISAANVYDIVGLIDGGANGGLATKDEMRLLSTRFQEWIALFEDDLSF